MSGFIDTLAPARLGVGFRWLLASSWISNLGDGIAIAAGRCWSRRSPTTRSWSRWPRLVQWLPQLLFALFAGALSDRLDRRLIVVIVDVMRAIVAGGHGHHDRDRARLDRASCWSPSSSVATAEVFADNASQTLLPMLVRRDDLVLANARIQAGFVTLNQLAGPPIGAALFAIGMALPFIGQAILVAAGALLVSRITLPPHRRDPAARQPRSATRSPRASDGCVTTRGPDAGADDLHLQHHVRRGLVGAGPVRDASGSGWARSASGCSRPSRRSAACSAPSRTGGSPDG